MGLSKKSNIKIIQNRLREIVKSIPNPNNNEQREQIATKEGTITPNVKKCVDNLMKDKRPTGRKKNPSLIDGGLLLTC